MQPIRIKLLPLALITLLAACEEPAVTMHAGISQSGTLQSGVLDEVSGVQSGSLNPEVWFAHNDDGDPILYAFDTSGKDLGEFLLEGASNRDWEDITAVPSPDGPLLLVADTGDNFAQWDSVTLYFVAEPEPGKDGRFSGSRELAHRIDLTYPDGARDCESVAYDAASDTLFLLSKRDKPPRVYSISREDALAMDSAELVYEGETAVFRPPTAKDMLYFGQRDGPWVSQPTGFDISADGRHAAVISYRSIYLWDREAEETWAQALQRAPDEFEGPPARKEEAIAYAADDHSILVTTEGLPAPVYLFRRARKSD